MDSGYNAVQLTVRVDSPEAVAELVALSARHSLDMVFVHTQSERREPKSEEWTSERVRWLLAASGMTPAKFGLACGAGETTAYNWISGRSLPNAKNARGLNRLRAEILGRAK